jgi:hypothetical protein
MAAADGLGERLEIDLGLDGLDCGVDIAGLATEVPGFALSSVLLG